MFNLSVRWLIASLRSSRKLDPYPGYMEQDTYWKERTFSEDDWFLTFRRKNVKIIASIESALGIMNIKEIATSDPRVDALVVRASRHGNVFADKPDTDMTREIYDSNIPFKSIHSFWTFVSLLLKTIAPTWD